MSLSIAEQHSLVKPSLFELLSADVAEVQHQGLLRKEQRFSSDLSFSEWELAQKECRKNSKLVEEHVWDQQLHHVLVGGE